MPIRRTSNRSSQDTGFYTPEVYNDVGSRSINPPPTPPESDWIDQYYDWEPFQYEDVTGIWIDWYPQGTPAPSTSDYWADMASQMFSWESLAYIEWWGN